MRLVDLSRTLGTKIEYAGSDLDQIQIEQVTGITQAKQGALTFLASPEYRSLAEQSSASALITREIVPGFKGPQLLHKDPHFAYAKAAGIFHRVDHGSAQINPDAKIDPSAELGQNLVIHAGVTIGPRAKIADHCVLYPGVYVGADAELGEHTVLYPHVVVYQGCVIGRRCTVHASSVIGADGFGYAVSGGEICKIPQIGIVRIGDDVEIGALSSIDRATHGETLIKNNVKIDNHVQIGHNVEVGENSMFSAQTGVAGSSRLGNWVLMGGQSGVADHLVIADRVRIAAASAVINSLPEAGTYVGFPAVPQPEWGRGVVGLRRLRNYETRLREIEKKLGLTAASSEETP